jgi:hypothetical protein
MKTAFIVLQFGKPHEWTQKYLDHLAQQEQYGYYWKIITPNKYDKVPSNVEIVDMNIEQFNQLCEAKLGVKPTLRILDKGIPNFHITDTMVFWGTIFEDYLKDMDYWGLIGLDCVVGRLDHFIKDFDFDVYSDDINTFNGNFALMRNIPKVNELWKHIKDWEVALQQPDCAGCIGTGEHFLYGTDEYGMTTILRGYPEVKFKYPRYFIHGHDRLELHQPVAKLRIEDDGSLWELIEDVNPPLWVHQHQNFGHEIAYYHFNIRKQWPL